MRKGLEQSNGNTQLNNARDEYNQRLSKLAYLGKAKRLAWADKRRNRTL